MSVAVVFIGLSVCRPFLHSLLDGLIPRRFALVQIWVNAGILQLSRLGCVHVDQGFVSTQELAVDSFLVKFVHMHVVFPRLDQSIHHSIHQ